MQAHTYDTYNNPPPPTQAQHTTLQAQLTAAQSAASNHTQHITHLEATLKQQADAHAAAVAQNAEEHCTQQQAMEQAHGEIVKEHKAELERCQKQVEELFAQHAQQQSQAAAQVASLHALVNALQVCVVCRDDATIHI